MCCSGCSVLYTLQQTAPTRYNILQRTATSYNVLQRTATMTQGDKTLANASTTKKQQTTQTTATTTIHCYTLLQNITRCNILQQRTSKTKRQETRPSMCRQRGRLCQPPCPLAPCLFVSFLHTPKNRVNEHISAGTCPLLQMSQQGMPKASVALCCSVL